MEDLDKPQVIFICGNTLSPEYKPDWVLEARLNLALEQAKSNTNAIVIASGGVSISELDKNRPAEAEVMRDYLLEHGLKNELVCESSSENTIIQLCYLKKEYFEARKLTRIAIITDEIHLPRVMTLVKGVFYEQGSISCLGAKINLCGTYRKAIEELEAMFLKTAEEITSILPKGDTQAYLKYTKTYFNLRKEMLAKGISPTQSIDVAEVYRRMQTEIE
jgi:hypothetical protein